MNRPVLAGGLLLGAAGVMGSAGVWWAFLGLLVAFGWHLARTARSPAPEEVGPGVDCGRC